MPESAFKDLAALRSYQGFSAIQLVVGVPPEVGPENENARSQAGFPWTLDGQFNEEYLKVALERIQFLNSLGFIVVVYGAWGHQIAWLGKEGMAKWWHKIIEMLDCLDVIYCLCGESSLWVGNEWKLLPDKSTDDFVATQVLPSLHPKIRNFLSSGVKRLKKVLYRNRYKERHADWSYVLEGVSRRTHTPIIVHPTADETGYEAVCNPELLSANTAQTGHDVSARNRLWRLPLDAVKKGDTHKGFINLEPWYEGIGHQFWAEDQMFSYWATMLAGATSYCYGAHGIWNVGDGSFLAHWGKQTFSEARALDTPRLLGLSHKQYVRHSVPGSICFYEVVGKQLLTIGRRMGERTMQFLPDIAKVKTVPRGKIWLPLQGVFVHRLPKQGQVVLITGEAT